MSWNDSGDGKEKDPWSGRDKQQGPPDLDEVVRSLQEKLGKLFGGGGKKSGNGGPGRSVRPPAGSWMVLLGIALLIWVGSGIYIVNEGNRAVVLRFGEYVETTLPGPHWHIPTPIERVEIVNVEQQRFVEIGYRSGANQQPSTAVKMEALMLTTDENIIDVKLAVQYRVKNAAEYLFFVRDPDETLKSAAESAIRSVIGQSRMDFVLTEGRSEVVAEAQEQIQGMLDLYQAGLQVTSVNLVEAQPPEEVQGAFSDAIKAREDEQRQKNEAEAYSNEIIPKARGAAARMVQEAQGYRERVIAEAEGDASRFTQLLAEYEKAPDLTRKRLYLETLEEVLGNANKVVVDVKGGNNLMYLPLDRMINMQTPDGSESSSSRFEIPSSSTSSTDTRSNIRGREGRGR